MLEAQRWRFGVEKDVPFAPTADTIARAGVAVFSGFVSLTSRVMRAQFSPLREALKAANSGV